VSGVRGKAWPPEGLDCGAVGRCGGGCTSRGWKSRGLLAVAASTSRTMPGRWPNAARISTPAKVEGLTHHTTSAHTLLLALINIARIPYSCLQTRNPHTIAKRPIPMPPETPSISSATVQSPNSSRVSATALTVLS
jgi:hypothetical protein